MNADTARTLEQTIGTQISDEDEERQKMQIIFELISDIKLGILYKSCVYQQHINELQKQLDELESHQSNSNQYDMTVGQALEQMDLIERIKTSNENLTQQNFMSGGFF